MNFTYEKNETGKHICKLLQTFSSANELSNFGTASGKHCKVSTFYLCVYLGSRAWAILDAEITSVAPIISAVLRATSSVHHPYIHTTTQSPPQYGN